MLLGMSDNDVSGEGMFYDNCSYDLGSDQTDNNKLIRIGLSGVHTQSYAIGWYYKEEKIHLTYYCY